MMPRQTPERRQFLAFLYHANILCSRCSTDQQNLSHNLFYPQVIIYNTDACVSMVALLKIYYQGWGTETLKGNKKYSPLRDGDSMKLGMLLVAAGAFICMNRPNVAHFLEKEIKVVHIQYKLKSSSHADLTNYHQRESTP